jgi:hypothetical protein
MEPRWTPMASTTLPSVEANISTLMNVVDEEIWREEGLYDKMGVDDFDTDSFTKHLVNPPPIAPSRSFLSPVHAPSFANFLPTSSKFTKPVEHLIVALSREDQSKPKLQFNQSKVGGKEDVNPCLSRRQWRAKITVHKMILGSDVGLVEACSLALYGLVGILSYRYLCKVSLLEWVDLTWKSLLGYVPEVIFLTKGWVGFICKTPEDFALLMA